MLCFIYWCVGKLITRVLVILHKQQQQQQQQQQQTKMMKMTAAAAAAYLLPSELIYNILSRLPIESLFRIRCVCRSLRALIDDPFLREMHTHRMLDHKQSDSDSVSFLLLARFSQQQSFYEFHFGEYFDKSSSSSPGDCYKVPKPIKHGRIYFNKEYSRYSEGGGGTIVGSCNGLVCFGTFIYETHNLPDFLSLFNPVTKEYLRIPQFVDDQYQGVHQLSISMYGFGYLSSTNEYKVVRIYYQDYDYSPGRVQVYTLGGTRKWRSIGLIPCIFVSFVQLPGVLVNEALHWIDNDGKIALFDLATEKFRMVSSPSLLTLVPNNARYYELGVMCGTNLCVIEHNIHKSVDIWVMDNQQDTEEEGSWTMEFKIPIREEIQESYDADFYSDWEEFDDYNFITITKSGKVLLWYNGTGLVSYDTKTEEFTFHGDYKADMCWFEAVLHMKSFVSFKSLGENSVRFAELED